MSSSSRAMHLLGITVATVLLSPTSFGQTPEENPKRSITFYRDVLPIVQTKCQGCHRTGGVAPMSFLTYESTRPWARAMKTATQSKKMPPWNLDPQYGRFKDDPTLTPEEIAIISAWADAGAAAGDATNAPSPREFVEGWRTKPDVVLTLPPFDVPAKGVFEDVVVVLQNPFKEDTWVTSVEISPGVPAVMHHAGVSFAPHVASVQYNVPIWSTVTRDEFGIVVPGQEKNIQHATYCDETRRKTCPVDASKIPSHAVAFPNEFYRPGTAPLDYAYYNSGQLVPANADFVFSLHYNTNGTAVTDVTRLGLTIAKRRPQKQLKNYLLEPRGAGGWRDRTRFKIPAGASDWEAAPIDILFNMDTELAELSLHMHETGKDMTFTVYYPDGRSEIVLKSPTYDFNWQILYNLVKPMKLPKGTKMRIVAHYNNSRSNKYARYPDRDIYGGAQSWEEMMAPWIGLLLDPDVDQKSVITLNPGDESTFVRSGN